MDRTLELTYVREIRTRWAVLVLMLLARSRRGRRAVDSIFRIALGGMG